MLRISPGPSSGPVTCRNLHAVISHCKEWTVAVGVREARQTGCTVTSSAPPGVPKTAGQCSSTPAAE